MWFSVKPYLKVTESYKIYRYLGAKNIMTKAKTNVFYLLKRKFIWHSPPPPPHGSTKQSDGSVKQTHSEGYPRKRNSFVATTLPRFSASEFMVLLYFLLSDISSLVDFKCNNGVCHGQGLNLKQSIAAKQSECRYFTINQNTLLIFSLSISIY